MGCRSCRIRISMEEYSVAVAFAEHRLLCLRRLFFAMITPRALPVNFGTISVSSEGRQGPGFDARGPRSIALGPLLMLLECTGYIFRNGTRIHAFLRAIRRKYCATLLYHCGSGKLCCRIEGLILNRKFYDVCAGSLHTGVHYTRILY